MDNQTIKAIEKGESFTDQICAMKAGEELNFDGYYESTIRVLCSSKDENRPGRPLVKYPKRQYKVAKDRQRGIVTVKRIK